ncbi:MAG: ABC transporter substrate-binding protein, partial [Anaerolineae bacterium]|nr:ABC transporter substrate-binding protein [Anaerolineae bacterium]
ITLGLNYPRTGSYKEEGLAQMRGALLAIDEINQGGGVLGRPLQLISRNTASRPDKAIANVDKMADEGVAMLFGGVSSAVAIAASKRAKERGLLYFGTLTYSNDTTGKDGHRYMFRECNNAWMSARVLGQYLNENMPGKTYFYITSDYTWGHTSESSLRQATGTVDTSKHQGVRTAFPGARLSDYRAALEKAAN